MPKFTYRATAPDGRSVVDQIEADDVQAAMAAVESQGLSVRSIRPARADESLVLAELASVPEPSPATATGNVGPTSNPQDDNRVARQHLTELLRGNPSIPAALAACAEELPPGRTRRELGSISAQLAAGNDPWIVLSSNKVSPRWLPMLAAAAKSGKLTNVLNDVMDESIRSREYVRKLLRTVGYPLIAFVLALAVLTVISWLVVPTFEQVILDFDTEIPTSTRLVFGICRIVRENAVYAMLAVLLLALGGYFTLDRLLKTRWFDTVPVLGRSLLLAAYARFAQTLAELFEAQVPMVEALRLAGSVAGRPSVQAGAEALAAQIASGQGEAFEAFEPSLPRTVQYVVRGDQPLEVRSQVLRALASMFDREQRRSQVWVLAIVEPVSMILVGTVVAFTVMSLFLPLISLVTNLSQ